MLRGFTLIEILVVLLIISIMTGVALISVRFNAHKQLQTFSEEIRDRLRLAEEEALLLPAVIGVKITDHQLQFMQSINVIDKKTQRSQVHWQPLHDHYLANLDLPNNIYLSIKSSQVKDNNNTQTPMIIFSTNGDVAPFALQLGIQGERPAFVIIGEDTGAITNQTINYEQR